MSDIERLKLRLERLKATKETYVLAKKVLEELEDIERRWGRIARASLGGHVK